MFVANHPRSLELYNKAQECMLGGVPMHWMKRWEGRFPVYVKSGSGGRFEDVDGHSYIDFCLGDTGSMIGHSPPAVVDAIEKQMRNGLTFMLPSEDSLWVANDMKRRFGLQYWQFTLSASDANRFAIRLARYVTGRKYVLVFNWCYHGSVDESFATLDEKGKVQHRVGQVGPPVHPSHTTKVVEWNDVAALEAALAPGDVACVLAEPAMTNIGIILPAPGYLDKLRELTEKTGTLLIIDETHTMSAGPGGMTGEEGLKPDMLTVGKAIGGGIPCGAYGFSSRVGEMMRQKAIPRDTCDTGGVGGTLAANVLSMATMRATLEHILTPKNYARNIPLAIKFQEDVERVMAEFKLPWIIKRLGCRVEYWMRPTSPVNGTEAVLSIDTDLDRFMHIYALNRGILMTPFHNMALIAPDTTVEDIDYHTLIFRNSVLELLGQKPEALPIKKPAKL